MMLLWSAVIVQNDEVLGGKMETADINFGQKSE
jgi:hypothetical protein